MMTNCQGLHKRTWALFPADLALPLFPSLVVSRVATGTARVSERFEVTRLMETSSAWELANCRPMMAQRRSRDIMMNTMMRASMGSMVLLVSVLRPVLGQSLALRCWLFRSDHLVAMTAGD